MRKFLGVLILCPALARAALQGPPIVDSHYRVDVSQEIVFGSTRKVALGGAYTSIAEGVSSLSDNPAGVAFRPTRADRTWNWDATLGGFAITGDNYDNNGNDSLAYENNRVITTGLLLQRKAWGVGLLGVGQQYQVVGPTQKNLYQFSTGMFAFGASAAERQLTWGLGFRPANLQVFSGSTDRSERLFLLSGTGITVGTVWHPHRGRFRLGATYSSAIKSDRDRVQSSSAVVVNGLIVPEQVALPAQGAVGVSYIWPSAPFWKGRSFLVSGDLRVSGKTNNAVGVESMIEQRIQRSGEHATVSAHYGMELEAWPGHGRLRLGTYREPSRFAGVSARQHLTGGFEMKLFQFHFFGERNAALSYAFDVTSGYFNNFLSVGLWYF